MSTDSQDPNDPQDPNGPPDPNPPTTPTDGEVAETDAPSVYELEPEPTMDLAEDAAITEEVPLETLPPPPAPVSAVSEVVPLRTTGFEPPQSTPPSAVPTPSTPSTGQYVRFGIALGIGLGLVLGIPVCGDVASWGLPPVLGGILLVLYSARWQGPSALDPQRLSMGAAMMGVFMGGIVTVGLGIRAWMNRGLLEAELLAAGQGQFSTGQVLMVGMVCLLPVTQLIYAGLSILAARWTLSKLRSERT